MDQPFRRTERHFRDFISSKMTPVQIAEAQRLAREWMEGFEKQKKN